MLRGKVINGEKTIGMHINFNGIGVERSAGYALCRCYL